jgi:hypothetical protein
MFDFDSNIAWVVGVAISRPNWKIGDSLNLGFFCLQRRSDSMKYWMIREKIYGTTELKCHLIPDKSGFNTIFQ